MQSRYDYRPTTGEVEEIRALFNNNFVVPDSFVPVKVVPGHLNPQSMWLLEQLKLGSGEVNSPPAKPEEAPKKKNHKKVSNPDEIEI